MKIGDLVKVTSLRPDAKRTISPAYIGLVGNVGHLWDTGLVTIVSNDHIYVVWPDELEVIHE